MIHNDWILDKCISQNQRVQGRAVSGTKGRHLNMDPKVVFLGPFRPLTICIWAVVHQLLDISVVWSVMQAMPWMISSATLDRQILVLLLKCENNQRKNYETRTYLPTYLRTNDNNNRTKWSPIWSVITWMITKSNERRREAGVRFANHEDNYKQLEDTKTCFQLIKTFKKITKQTSHRLY